MVIYTRVEQSHRSSFVIVNFEHITPSSSVSTVDLEHIFFSGSDLFTFQSFLDQDESKFHVFCRKNFIEVEHCHEVVYAAPRFIIFESYL